MPKKRGKQRGKSAPKRKHKAVSKKKTKQMKAAKEPVVQPAETKITLQDALHDLEIISEEKKVEHKVAGIQKKEAAIMGEEKKIEKETEKIEKIEKEINQKVTTKPLKALKMSDINKGIVGAFIGVVAHYAFVYGKQIAKDISMTRATILVVFSYILIIILMYETGYRQIKESRLFGVLPKRATVIYFTSIVVILFIFFLFNQLDFSNLDKLYKEIAVTLVLASVGAGTADLIGKD